MRLGDIDMWRKGQLALAEAIDAWRVVPRLLVAGYSFVLWYVIQWYVKLEPYIIDGCDAEALGTSCIVMAPTTQHAALVSTVVGIAAAVFGLYANSGRKWNGFTEWKKSAETTEDKPQP